MRMGTPPRPPAANGHKETQAARICLLQSFLHLSGTLFLRVDFVSTVDTNAVLPFLCRTPSGKFKKQL